MGAGMLTNATYAAAHCVGHHVVGGMHLIISITGGYPPSSGHSLLTPLHGLGTDNALE
jgi:hypothetical protein